MRNLIQILTTFLVLAITTHLQSSIYLSGYRSIFIQDYNPINPEADSTAYMISGSNITIEAWIYPIGLPEIGQKSIIVARSANYDFSASTGVYADYELSIDNTGTEDNPRLAFTLLTGTDASDLTTLLSDIQVQKEKWTHVAATYDGNNMYLYANGQLVGSTSKSGKIQSEGVGFMIGTAWFGSSFAYNINFYGLIDDVRLWKVTRTKRQILTNMNNRLEGNEEGLAGYWPFIELTDHITPDKTDNHNDLWASGYLSTATPQNMIGKTAHLEVDTSPIDFGEVERPVGKADSIEIHNSGDGYLYGEIHYSTNDLIEISKYASRYFLDPGDREQHFINIIPKMKGAFSGNFIFDEGNADNLGIQVPFSGISVRREGFDANNIDMWINSNGTFAYYRGAGLEWPKFSGKNVVYSSGIWVGAKVNGAVHTAISARSSSIQEFAPGPIIDGQPADPNDPEYQVYKIEVGDNAENNPDYANWPAHLGAPVNSDGTPALIGEQMLWVVYNDLNEANHWRTNSMPLGAEIQQSVFGWADDGAIGNTVFLRFKLINKSDDVWKDTYFALWSDPDVGYYADDFVGVDTVRNMGYCYNAVPEDRIYGEKPPAVGYDILKGAFYSKPIQAFSYYDYRLSYPYEEPRTAGECYNYIRGLLQNGQPHIDPYTLQPSTFPLNGDPVTGSGWIDTNMGDRRFLLSTGPFDLEPGQGKEIVAAIIIDQGEDNLSSITALRVASDSIQQKYDAGDLFGGAIENVTVEEINGGEKDTLNDIANSGAEFEMTGGESGATVEVATYIDAPPGTEHITESAIHGVGKYIDVQVSGDIEWPMKIKMYYTQNDLDQAGIHEDEILGMYYWSVSREEWVLYSESGDDDQGRGPSTTGVSTENLEIDGNHYQGYVWAEAYHLTTMRMGSKIDSALLGMTDQSNNFLKTFYLKQNYPNPFNSTTTIQYFIPKSDFVSLKIFDILGHELEILVQSRQNSGNYLVHWDASGYPSGIYFYQLKTGKFCQTKKFLLIK